jgi:hypothetical protein
VPRLRVNVKSRTASRPVSMEILRKGTASLNQKKTGGAI